MAVNEALRGVVVLDFAQVGAGPTCGMLLGDLGAEVIKIEAPGGDIGRKLGPPWQAGESVVSMSFNRNKRSLVLDLKQPQGRGVVERMAAADRCGAGELPPGVMDKLGIGYAQLVGGVSGHRVLFGLRLRPERTVARQARRRWHRAGSLRPDEPCRQARIRR